jgi:hypothetical protein
VTRGFRRTKKGVTATFDSTQAGVLRRLASDIDELMQLRGDAERTAGASQDLPSDDPLAALFADFATGSAERPDDPVLARLLPDGYAGATDGDEPGSDADAGADAGAAADAASAAADFRRFTEADLRAGKSETARLILDSLPPDGGIILLDDDGAMGWLRGLNDMRLSLGTALEVGPDTEEEYLRLDPMSSRARRLYLYFWLGVLQETLIDAVTDL